MSVLQNDGKMGNISALALPGSCNEDTFDIVLGSDGDCTLLNSGTHWDCWTRVSINVPWKDSIPDHSKLGRHLGLSSWRDHILWLDQGNNPQAINQEQAPVVDRK